ncbi:MAG TPA: AgmX/PglI C-terminal domain-containing protein [Vulgatibacter sp.]|nr:AgmX/PglI C-terminal domain-containing protein [Vulgatibacter sp.]
MSDEPSNRSSAAPAGEFLFKQGELVFGPVPASYLMEKLASGELPPDTLVAREGAAFAPMGEVTVFMEQAARASARRRVEAQARAEAKARRLRRALKLGAVIAVAVVTATGAVAGVTAAIRAGVFERSHEALADLPIQASPPLVAIAPGGGDVELEYLGDDRRPGRAPAAQAGRSAGRPRAERSERAGDGGYDSASIQAVVAANQHRLFPCIRAEAAKDPTFRGEVPFSFTVGNEGRVVKLWIDRRGHETGALHACMEAQLAKWKFPVFAGERPSVSLSFRVGGG